MQCNAVSFDFLAVRRCQRRSNDRVKQLAKGCTVVVIVAAGLESETCRKRVGSSTFELLVCNATCRPTCILIILLFYIIYFYNIVILIIHYTSAYFKLPVNAISE